MQEPLRADVIDLAESQPELNSTVTDPPGRWTFLGYGAPCAVAWTTYLILHWPGMLSNDSVGEWLAAVEGNWLDNPIMMQFMIWLVTRVWFSPGAVLLVYILAFSGLIGLALARQRTFGLPLSLALLTSFGIALFPTHMRVATWLLNDLPYTISMLALTIVILEIVQSSGAWLKRGHHAWILLGLAAASTALHRHNGPVPAFLTLACLLLVYRRGWWRRVAAAMILAGMLFLTVKGPVIKALEARSYLVSPKPTLISALFVWPIAAHLNAGTPMSFGRSLGADGMEHQRVLHFDGSKVQGVARGTRQSCQPCASTVFSIPQCAIPWIGALFECGPT